MRQRGRLLIVRGEGGRTRRIQGTSFLCLRGSDFLSSNPLAQHHKGVTDLEVGTSNRDVALVPRARGQRIGVDSGARNVVDLFKALPALTDNVLGRRVRYDDCDEVAVGLALRRERLSKGEGDGIWKGSSLPGRTFLLS
jgi:hypothetical protein